MTFKVGDKVRCKNPKEDKINGVGVVVVNSGLTIHNGKPLCYVYFKSVGENSYRYVENLKSANTVQRNLPAWW